MKYLVALEAYLTKNLFLSHQTPNFIFFSQVLHSAGNTKKTADAYQNYTALFILYVFHIIKVLYSKKKEIEQICPMTPIGLIIWN